jgi:hypothetical protein
MIPYRVFVSYSHDKDDEELVEEISKNLENEGLTVMWDQKFSVGTGFHEQIKNFIAYSHVFLPIITESSNERGWIHQEIGYAVANNIPILPLAIEKLPDAMMRELHAILVPRDPDRIKEKLKYDVFANLIQRYENPIYATYQCAEFAEDRAILLTKYAHDVIWMHNYGLLRQKGGLTSFQIPREVIFHEIWTQRYGKTKRGSPFQNRCQRGERLALEEHAAVAGCKLIIDPSFSAHGELARKKRLKCLNKFLKSSNGKKAKVTFHNKESSGSSSNVTIIGDWFYSESQSGKPERGYNQTIFTRHAPSIQHRIELFDKEFSELLKKQRWDEDNCREYAIKDIDEIINSIKVN